MRNRWLLAGALAASLTAPPLWAQEASPDGEAPVSADAAAAEPLLSDEELDDLVAPVALYPDSLLTQVLVAATYPLDIIKAARFLSDNAELSDKDRADAAAGEDWDPSVQVLVSGFPTVVERMADDIDWTEDLGDAMLAQTDDLLDAVQRMRARAEASGNLTSNEAQTVATEGDSISIAPADPQVVYVPSYDPVTTYTTPVTSTVVDSGISTGDVLATGAIAFGTALLVDEIFDDDDDWDDYWYGPRHIDWDDDRIYPGRRGVYVDGDVNVDVDRNRNRNRIDIDRNEANRKVNNRTKIGVDDGDRKNKGAWEPDRDKQKEARDKLATREASKHDRPDKLKARDDKRDTGAKDKLEAANKKREPSKRIDTDTKPRPEAPRKEAKKPEAKPTALKPGSGGSAKTKAATDRGAESLKKDKSKVATKARAPEVSKPKAISKPKPQAKAPPRKPQAKPSAFSKSSSGGRAKAASNRGAKVKKRH